MKGSRPEMERWIDWSCDVLDPEQQCFDRSDGVWFPGAFGQTLSIVTPDAVGVVPERYEPRYAYPLIVWLCNRDCPSSMALHHIAALSPQNYVGLCIDDGELPEIDPSHDARDVLVRLIQQLVRLENRIVTAVRAMRKSVHVHSERIFLAGVGQSAAAALLVAMHQPEWFGGCVAFAPPFPPGAQLIAQRRNLSDRRFWLAAPTGPRLWRVADEVRHAARQLIATGAQVTTQLYPDKQPVTRAMLRDVDQWIISGILSVG